MSAFLCTDAHFDALADYVARHHVTIDAYRLPALAREQCRAEFGDGQIIDLAIYRKRLGRILRDQNVRSVRARYGACSGDDTPYEYRPTTKRLPDAWAISAARCLDYQSNETTDWDDTLAHAICEAIREAAIASISNSPVPWGIEEEHVR